MAHGFEKLERLFTASRRKRRGKQNPTRHQKTPSITARRPSSPTFPLPPYLRPTSTHMIARDAQIDGAERDINRAWSVPSLQEALDKRDSITSTVTVVDQPSQPDASTSLRRRSRHLQPMSRPSRFRFPEDSLFRNNQPIGGSVDSVRKSESPETSPRTCATEPQGLLDWNPKHISLLFNPLEFKTSSNDLLSDPISESTESTLLPSPDFSHSTLSPVGVIDKPSKSTTTQLSLFPNDRSMFDVRQPNLSSYQKPLMYSPPLSESDEDEDQKRIVRRSVSFTGLSPSSLGTVCTTPITTPATSIKSSPKNRQTVRETWGSRRDDPRFGGISMSSNDGTSKLKLRKSASTSTLSTLTPTIPRGTVLKEPTFDDFYALSDDDIAETWPSTPDVRVPPTPPSMYTPDARRKNGLPPVLTSQHVVFKPGQEAITPPDTPTDGHLTLTYSPTDSRDTLGTLWASKLAEKYDFSVVYVMSLWPVIDGRCLDVSTNGPANGPLPYKATAGGIGTSSKGSRISGRLLAAYGLNEVPAPFEIVTDTHLSALGCDYWNEYRNVDARPDDISRGWIRPLYSDYVPLSTSSEATGDASNDHPKNRGIIFAAYSKQTYNPIIPMRASPEQELRLGQLYLDAKALVDAVVMQPGGSKKAPVFLPS